MKRIYMDHAATTPVDARVAAAMKPFLSQRFGNASSLHTFGQEAKEALEESRAAVARAIGAAPDEIIFTSGGTESDNMALKGSLKRGDHLITSAIEHHAVLHTAQYLEPQGVQVTYLPVDRFGLIDPADVEAAIKPNTKLVSIMHVNNEIGAIEPVAEIGVICRRRGVLFHTDAVQGFGKLPIDVRKMNIDMLSASAHKLCGPKGVGLLYIRNGIKLAPLMHGGGHERGRRSGTENVAGIVGFAKAMELAVKDMKKENAGMKTLSEKLVKRVLAIPDSHLNGHPQTSRLRGRPAKRLACINNFRFAGIEGESLVIHLDMQGVAASTGSACSSRSLEPSHVLTAIGLKHADAHGSLRLSLGRGNTAADVDYVAKVLPGIVENLRRISPLAKGK
ncbi:MAG: cysteine desulfurase [Candidatus Aenigmarchaeota archaeon]|nr:cysteine desulfurase [Candidatus Aenigmarchaeota archaeon]